MSGSKEKSRRDTADKPSFEITWSHSGWRKCSVSCAVVVGVQQCAGNVLYPLVHRTFQSHIYRTDADMFGEFSLGHAIDRRKQLA